MRSLALAMGIAVFWFLLAASGALESLERLSVQARYALRPAPGYTAPVTIVAIDERSLARYGQMPWDRRVFARLLGRLAEGRAAVVGVDVAFNEPAHDPGEDAALAAALRGVPTVLPTFLAFTDATRRSLGAIEPQPAFAAAAVALGSVQFTAQPQAEVWELEPYQDALSRRVPAFPVAIAGAFKGSAWSPPWTGFPWRRAPYLLDYRGPAGSAPQVSATDVLEGRVPASAFAGRIVLVGAVATGLPDTNFAVPDFRGGPMSGVELATNAIDNLLTGGFLRRFDLPALGLLLALLALGPGRWLARGGHGARPHVAKAVGLAAAWGTIALAAFWVGVWVEVVPVLGLLAGCTLAGVLVERTELLESRNTLLARYASDLASEAQRQRLRIEGELHDGIQQLLIVMGRETRQLRRQSAGDPADARVELLAGLVDQAQQEVKRLRGDLLPPALRYGGLLEALPALASEKSARGGFAIRVEVDGWEPLAREREVELYWLVTEALNNVEKHAAATEARIRLTTTRQEAIIEVIDDGCGFEPPDLAASPAGLEHSGLHRMWLRMRGAQGDLVVRRAPGGGTCVRFSVPVMAWRGV